MQSNLFCGAIVILKRTLAHSCCVTEAKVLPCLWPCWSGKNCRTLGLTESLLKDPRSHTALLTDGLWGYVHAILLAASLIALTHLWASLSPERHLYLGCEGVHTGLRGCGCLQVPADIEAHLVASSSHGVKSQTCSGGSFMKPWVVPRSYNTNFMDNWKLQEVLAFSLKEWSKSNNKYCAAGWVTAWSCSKGPAVMHIPREAEHAITWELTTCSENFCTCQVIMLKWHWSIYKITFFL